MNQSVTLHDVIDREDYVHVFGSGSTQTFAYVEVREGEDTTCARLTRAQAHELHAYLTEALGLSSPTPTAPLTASVPHRGGAKASRNALADRPAHKGYSFDVV